MERVITEIDLEVKNTMKLNKVIPAPYVEKNDFVIFKFFSKCIITNEILKEYTFTKSEFLTKDVKIQKKFKKFKKKVIFNKKEFKKHSKIRDNYTNEYYKIYNKILKKNNISKEMHLAFEGIMNIVFYNFDFDCQGCGTQDHQIQFETEIIDTLKTNFKK